VSTKNNIYNSAHSNDALGAYNLTFWMRVREWAKKVTFWMRVRKWAKKVTFSN
jgi:hypothetical protein